MKTRASEYGYCGDGGLPLLLTDGSTSYIYGPGGLPVEQISGEAPSYYHHDQLGSTRMLTNASGTVTGTFTYSAYGTLAGKTGSQTTPLGFAGQYTNAQSGLIYLRARIYDPATGQFLTRDPLRVAVASPYAYANANPLRFVDPAGECGISPDEWGEDINIFSEENCAYQATNSAIELLGGNAETVSQVTGALSAGLFATGVGSPVAAALAAISAATGAYAAGENAANGKTVTAAIDALGSALGSEALAYRLFGEIAQSGAKSAQLLSELGVKLRSATSAREVAEILDESGYPVLGASILQSLCSPS